MSPMRAVALAVVIAAVIIGLLALSAWSLDRQQHREQEYDMAPIDQTG